MTDRWAQLREFVETRMKTAAAEAWKETQAGQDQFALYETGKALAFSAMLGKMAELEG